MFIFITACCIYSSSHHVTAPCLPPPSVTRVRTGFEGCCEGDLVIIDFRDEQGDGNQGTGHLRLKNASHSDDAYMYYEIGPFWGMWKTYGPFCAPAGQHTLSFVSDAQTTETTVSIIDSHGLVRGRGGMNDFPSERHRRVSTANQHTKLALNIELTPSRQQPISSKPHTPTRRQSSDTRSVYAPLHTRAPP